MITKESIFKEFAIAKEKDIAKSTTKPPYENVFTNRIKVLESHRDAKKSNPNQYSNLDIKFDNLILAYKSPVPVDHFYKVVFGKTLAEYEHDKRVEEQKENDLEKKSAIN
jgi:hypothetical protein|tara:strand:- start:124 stop:453 length:330 start_codon:yes stop_codon:yes gene_type:complete